MNMTWTCRVDVKSPGRLRARQAREGAALPRLLMAAAAPAMTWLPLNVAIVDNDRGDSPSSYIARALRR